MNVTNPDVSARIGNSYILFAGWTGPIAAATTILFVETPDKGLLYPLLLILGALPAMLSAGAMIALSRFVPKRWQLLPLAGICGFVTAVLFIALYSLANAVAVWNATGTGFLEALAIATGGQSLGFVLLMPAILGGIPACISMSLWLVWRKKHRNHPDASPRAPHRNTPGKENFGPSERYFWKTVLLGPVILSLPLSLLLNQFAAGSGQGFLGLLQNILLLYYGGIVAAALCAAGVLAFARLAERRFTIHVLSICVGVHTGALSFAIFVPIDVDLGVYSLMAGGLLGAFSAWICAALWFPRGTAVHSSQVVTGGCAETRNWRLPAAAVIVPGLGLFAHGAFALAAPALGLDSDHPFIGRLRSFDARAWLLIYRMGIVTTILTMAILVGLGRNWRISDSLVSIIAPVIAFLVAAAMGQSLADYFFLTVTSRVAWASFLEFGLTGILPGVAVAVLWHTRSRSTSLPLNPGSPVTAPKP